MNKLLKIDNIMYFVKDLEESARFYEEVLGMNRRWADNERNMIGFTFEQSDSELVLHTDSTIEKYDFSFLVENVESFVDESKQKGCKIKLEPIEVRCGKFAILLDPEENIIPIIDLTKFGGKPRYDNK